MNNSRRQHDLSLAGKGFMLLRRRNGGRSWHRHAVPDLPGGSAAGEARYANQPANYRFAEPFEDFSGGDGYAYRSAAPPGGVHWSENMDLRFPGQAVHCQALTTVSVDTSGAGPLIDVTALLDVPLYGVSFPPPGAGAVGVIQRDALGAGDFDVYALAPATVGVGPGVFDVTQAGDAQHILAGRPASFGSFHYVPVATGNFYEERSRDFVSTTTLSWNGGGRHFAAAGQRLWRAFDLPSGGTGLTSLATGASAGDPAAWSATLPVGNGVGKATDLTSFGPQVFVGMPDGLYAGDQSGTFFNVTGELGSQVHPDNCRDLGVHEGEVVFPHVSGVFAYNPTTTDTARVRRVSPAQTSARSPVQGQHRALKSFGGWLYAGQFSGSASYLRAGREVAPGDWRWHTLNRLPHPSRVNRIHIDGVTSASGGARQLPQRLWVATDASFVTSGTSPLYVAPVPRLNHNPLAPDPVFSANYVGSARFDLPAIDRGAPGVLKVWERVEVWADALASGSRYGDVYYTLDRGARTLAGRVTQSPVTSLILGSLNGSFVVGRELEVSVESFTTTSGSSPVYRAVVVYGRVLPKHTEYVDVTITAADEQADRRGTPMRPGAVIVDDLRDLADPLRNGNRPVQMVDLAGATQWVTFVGMPEETEVWQQGQEAPELAVNARLAVLSFSAGA